MVPQQLAGIALEMVRDVEERVELVKPEVHTVDDFYSDDSDGDTEGASPASKRARHTTDGGSQYPALYAKWPHASIEAFVADAGHLASSINSQPGEPVPTREIRRVFAQIPDVQRTLVPSVYRRLSTEFYGRLLVPREPDLQATATSSDASAIAALLVSLGQHATEYLNHATSDLLAQVDSLHAAQGCSTVVEGISACAQMRVQVDRLAGILKGIKLNSDQLIALQRARLTRHQLATAAERVRMLLDLYPGFDQRAQELGDSAYQLHQLQNEQCGLLAQYVHCIGVITDRKCMAAQRKQLSDAEVLGANSDAESRDSAECAGTTGAIAAEPGSWDDDDPFPDCDVSTTAACERLASFAPASRAAPALPVILDAISATAHLVRFQPSRNGLPFLCRLLRARADPNVVTGPGDIVPLRSVLVCAPRDEVGTMRQVLLDCGAIECKKARSSWRKRTRCDRDEPTWLKHFHEDDRTGRFGEDTMTLV